MAALMRVNQLATLRNLLASTQRTVRCISTSPKKSDTATISTTEKSTNTETVAQTKNKNWVYYGFETENQTDDKNAMKSTFFFSVTLCLVFGTFIWSYLPDNQLRDWSQREGYLELRRREAAGNVPISPDYIERDLVELPTEADLADTEIII